MLLGALTPTAGLPPFLAAALPPASSMVMAVPPLPQPDSPGTQHSTLLLTEDPSLLTSCVLLKPPRLTSGPFLPPHNLPEPSLQYSFCESLPWVVSVCVCVCACMHVCELSHSAVSLFATPWTAARQAPQSLGFSRQEHCSDLPFPAPGDLPDPGIPGKKTRLDGSQL